MSFPRRRESSVETELKATMFTFWQAKEMEQKLENKTD